MNFFRGLFKRKPHLPTSTESFTATVGDMRRFTPDMVELEAYDRQLLFVCDETLPGMYQHKLIEDQEFAYEAFTQGPHIMLKEDLGVKSKPIIFPTTLGYQNPPPFVPIRGKVYRVEPRRFLDIDREKMNGVQFIRQKVWVVVPYQKLFFKDRQIAENVIGGNVGRSLVKRKGVWRFQAWIYYGNEEYWSDILNISLNPPVFTFKGMNDLVKEFYDFKLSETPPF